MGLLDLLTGKNINKWIAEFRQTPGGVLVDVRTRDEYVHGHIPGSVNIPLDKIETISKMGLDKDTPVYVYCRSGSRSGRALLILKSLKYTNVRNIGGIIKYKGKVETGR